MNFGTFCQLVFAIAFGIILAGFISFFMLMLLGLAIA